MTDDTLHTVFNEIARLASEPAPLDKPTARRIGGLANRGLAMLGNPDAAMAAKAGHAQKLVAEGVPAADAIARAGLDPGE